jgi:hypothetical protein
MTNKVLHILSSKREKKKHFFIWARINSSYRTAYDYRI